MGRPGYLLGSLPNVLDLRLRRANAWLFRGASSEGERRARALLIGLGAAAALAFVLGVVAGSGAGEGAKRAAARFATAWSRGDYPAMYALLSPAAARGIPPADFARAYRDAEATATLASLTPGRPVAVRGGAVQIAVTVRTRAFGVLRSTLSVPVKGDRVAWGPQLLFPGLRPGERLSARRSAPPRAALLARDGTPLARSGSGTTAPGPVAAEVAGRLGPALPEARAARRAAGFPEATPVGLTGLERVFESRLAGRPGGELLAGARVLTRARPRAAAALRTAIDPALERAAIASLAGRFGGAAAIDPRTGEVLALAGVAYSGLQPPGSTFKIITATAALEAHAVGLGTTFPIRTAAVIEGHTLQNANGESCGGTFLNAFAVSCNSVFAPLGARVGARRLVASAERFGFNRPADIPGAATSTIPPGSLGDDLAVGSSAIGQGRVQATALQMATVAAAIGEGGRRPRATLEARPAPAFDRATTTATAAQVGRLMRAVVTRGTGTSAAIPGVAVAGKTGTAELKDTNRPSTGTTATSSASNTDAWFVAYAPAGRPRVAVGVLLVKAGAGGATAAPVARVLLLAGLRR